MIKEMQNKASTNTVHLMNQLAASSPTPSKTVLISMKLHLLQTRCYERGKRKKKNSKGWLQILCMTATIMPLRSGESWGKRGGEIIYSDNTYCCGCHFICKLWEQRFRASIEMVLKMHSMLLFTGTAVPKYGGFANSKDLLSSFVCTWVKEEEADVFPYHTLFIPCLFVGFAPTRAAKVREESSNTELSSLAQHTVRIIDPVSWWAFSTVHFNNLYV